MDWKTGNIDSNEQNRRFFLTLHFPLGFTTLNPMFFSKNILNLNEKVKKSEQKRGECSFKKQNVISKKNAKKSEAAGVKKSKSVFLLHHGNRTKAFFQKKNVQKKRNVFHCPFIFDSQEISKQAVIC